MMLLVNGGNHKGINFLRYCQLVLFFFLSCFCSVYGSSLYGIKTVENLNIGKYLGVWHQIALIPNYFQKDCVDETQAEYEVLSDDSITILNSCLSVDGKRLVAAGIGRATGEPRNFARLKVSFAPKWLAWIPFVWGDYWILSIDDQYNSVLIGSPDRKYLWILSRQKFIQKESFANYLEKAKKNGFDTSLLVYKLSSLREG